MYCKRNYVCPIITNSGTLCLVINDWMLINYRYVRYLNILREALSLTRLRSKTGFN